MIPKAHFYTNDASISFLEYKSLYSFWLQHRDWYTVIYFTEPLSTKEPNWFNATFEFLGRKTEVKFEKLGLSNDASPEEKKEFLHQYVMNKMGGVWLEGNEFFFDHVERANHSIAIDKNLDITDKTPIDFATETGKALSLLNNKFIFDAIDYYSQGGKILDIGCGDKTMIQTLKNQNITTVDGWEKFKPDLLWDLNNTPLPYEDNSFDTVLALDLIEHLNRENGVALLQDLKRIARKNILLLTPLFWTDNTQNVQNSDSPYYQNLYDLHKSRWTLDDFKDWTRITDKLYYKDYFLGVWEA